MEGGVLMHLDGARRTALLLFLNKELSVTFVPAMAYTIRNKI